MIIVEVKDLVKRYPSFELKKISFELESERIIAAMPKADFIIQYSRTGESLEDTMLRLEGGAADA